LHQHNAAPAVENFTDELPAGDPDISWTGTS
jgi:hypothetical protein